MVNMTIRLNNHHTLFLHDKNWIEACEFLKKFGLKEHLSIAFRLPNSKHYKHRVGSQRLPLEEDMEVWVVVGK